MHAGYLNIQSGHILTQTSFKNEVKKSEDFDLYTYDEVDQAGNLIARYEVKDSTSIYPPFNRYIEYVKYDTNGIKIEEKRVLA